MNLTLAALGQEAFDAWGWRVPFLGGILIGLVGFYIRKCCEESPVYEEAKANNNISKTPIRVAFAKHPWEMVQGFALYLSVTMPFYLASVYFIGFGEKHLGLNLAVSLRFNIYNMLAMLITMPLGAWISDRIGRKKVLATGAVLMLLATPLLFANFTSGASPFAIGLSQFIFAGIVGLYAGVVPTILVELFPTSIRFTGMAISSNIAAALFGGTAPLICEWLITKSGQASAIGWYVMLCNAISLVALYFVKERFGERLK